MNSTRQSRRITLQSLTVCGALCFTFFLNMNSAGANEWVGIDPIDPIEPIATEHALVEHPFRTPSKPKTWIVERTTWPNPGLLRKIDPGVVVRVLELHLDTWDWPADVATFAVPQWLHDSCRTVLCHAIALQHWAAKDLREKLVKVP